MNIFIEASGGITSGYLIKSIQESGNRVIGSDISGLNHSVYLCDEFIQMPKISDSLLWDKTLKLLMQYEVDLVIPSLDETMEAWAEKATTFEQNGIKVIISPLETIKIFQDKWKTHLFFNEIGINTPKSSLNQDYELIKPRYGRGGAGIFKNDFSSKINMDGNISQEIINGIEYTVDAFYDKHSNPIYIIPRVRMDVKDGKSTKGEVIKNDKIRNEVIKISNKIKFIGPINFQVFETEKGELFFIEVNPRIAGGMALGFAASENWIELIKHNIVQGLK